MMRFCVLLGILALAACGSDGAPEPVGGGLTITGSSTIGIKKGS